MAQSFRGISANGTGQDRRASSAFRAGLAATPIFAFPIIDARRGIGAASDAARRHDGFGKNAVAQSGGCVYADVERFVAYLARRSSAGASRGIGQISGLIMHLALKNDVTKTKEEKK